MRIGIDARSYGLSTGTYARNLLRELQYIDDGNEYVVFLRPIDFDAFEPINTRFRKVRANFEAYTLGEQLGFLVLLLRERCDVVHFLMQQQPALYSGTKVTTFHDLTLLKYPIGTGLKSGLFRLLARPFFSWVLKSNDKIIAPTEFTKKELASFARVPGEKIAVTMEAADVTPSKAKKFELPFADFLLYVGNFYEYKNVKMLIESHRLLREKYPQLGLVLVGRLHAPGVQLQRWVADQGMEGVVFTGFIEDSERDWLYARSLAYVFPSKSEGFGLPGLEAMAMGAVVLSSNASCLPEVYGDGALYFDPDDAESLVDAVKKLVSDPVARKRLTERGRAVVDGYSWTRMTMQTRRIYDELRKSV